MKSTIPVKIKLDERDKKILGILQKNARMSVSKISKNTDLPRDAVVYRIKKMQKSGVIKFHHSVLDHDKLGYPLYAYVLFACYNLKPVDEKKFVDFLIAHKQIIYVAKNSGKYDFTIGVCAKDYKQFDEILRNIRQNFADVIKDIESLPTVEEYKFDWMADLINPVK